VTLHHQQPVISGVLDPTGLVNTIARSSLQRAASLCRLAEVNTTISVAVTRESRSIHSTKVVNRYNYSDAQANLLARRNGGKDLKMVSREKALIGF